MSWFQIIACIVNGIILGFILDNVVETFKTWKRINQLKKEHKQFLEEIETMRRKLMESNQAG